MNYNALMETQMAAIPAGTPLLLQACCGPCASSVIERLAGHFALSLLWYNPNIQPDEEGARRLETLKALLQHMPAAKGVRLIEAPAGAAAFTAAAKGLEAEPEGGARCGQCFRLRLEESARQAAMLGFQWFTTTLSVSPHKNAPLLNAIGSEAAARHGVQFLASDFKKKDGYRRSIELSREYGLYRQDYCGCLYSRASQ